MEWWEFFLVLIVVLPIMVLWLGCIIDAITRPDLSGIGKVLWVLLILFLPLIGSLVYILTRPAVVVRRRNSSSAPTALSWSCVPRRSEKP